MKIIIENIYKNPLDLMRKVGYHFQRKENDEMSFIRPLARSGYPRFHVYLKKKNNEICINIHLDHKKNTYGKSARHHAEYEEDSPLKTEIERIKEMLAQG
jgi:hypothetical protein